MTAVDPFGPVGDGATPLSEEDCEGLRLTFITTRGELNEAEQRNIVAATRRRREPSTDQLLDDRYLRELHRSMFGEVWTWAGHYRRRETNIGVDPTLIAVEVRNLVDDTRIWAERITFPPDEIAVRFHHRLVAIHPFANGNGRHSRWCADYLIRSLGSPEFSWGALQTATFADVRAQYLGALRTADAGDLAPLVAFVRS